MLFRVKKQILLLALREILNTIVPKVNNGWKIGMGLDTKNVFHTMTEGITIQVYRYKSTNDFFIGVTDTKDGTSKITDNHGSVFKYVKKTDSTLRQTCYTYYAYLNNFDNQYTLTVNNKSFKLQQ